jgi:hypothetical protein
METANTWQQQDGVLHNKKRHGSYIIFVPLSEGRLTHYCGPITIQDTKPDQAHGLNVNRKGKSLLSLF